MGLYFYPSLLLAGGVGAILRFWLGKGADSLNLTALPFGTLAANGMGCFLIGYLAAQFVSRWSVSGDMQTVLLTGFLGGFTTFSAFSLETVVMLQNGDTLRAMLYVSVSLVLSISLCFCGIWFAK